MPDLSTEIMFNTARSGGKGGQNVNKVETMVEGYWLVADSKLYNEEEKKRIAEKLTAKININGFLQVKSQAERTQLGNKAIVIKKIQDLVEKALLIPKPRKKTNPTAASRVNRINEKRLTSDLKVSRKKIKAEE